MSVSKAQIWCLLSLTLLLVSQFASAQSGSAPELSVMTFNIRYNNPGDGEHAWPYRKERVAQLIQFHDTDLVGVQEALRGQIDDLSEMLPEFAWVGVGRDDGKDAGEFSPIFYRRDRFTLEDTGTFWLSESPEVIGSKSWDAAITRIANWALFEDSVTGESLLHLNTHFDHRGEQARINSAALIVERLPQLASELPVIVTGDFNVPPTNEVYEIMTGSLQDAYTASVLEPYGPQGTFSGFEVVVTPDDRRIDYVFVDSGTEVLRYGALSDQLNGSYPSDHLPVLVEIRLGAAD